MLWHSNLLGFLFSFSYYDLTIPTFYCLFNFLRCNHESGATDAAELLASYEDVDSVNLRASLELENGQISSCLSLLSTVEPTAETFRVKAFAHLAEKNLNQAQLDIQKAQELQPRWVTIRYAKAVIDYFSALSTSILPARLVSWPEPVDWIFVKQDSESKLRLQAATNEFDALAANENETPEERQRLRIWSLACQANRLDRQENAANYCQNMLQESPASHPVIIWALARGYETELSMSLLTLEKMVDEESANISHYIALLICYHRTGRFDDVLQILGNTKAVFQESNAIEVWDFWRIRALISLGEKNAARQFAEQFESDNNTEKSNSALFLIDVEDGNWASVAEHFIEVYEETGDSQALLSYCEALAKQQQWVTIADRAVELVEKIRTAGVVHFASNAANNARCYDLCVKLLDDNRDLFENAKLPPNLRHLRMVSERALGQLSSAISEAQQLWEDEPNLNNLVNLIVLLSDVGDLKHIAFIARELKKMQGVPVALFLQVIHLIMHEDQKLSVDLWYKAIQQGVPDIFVGDAVFTGYQLGLDKNDAMRVLMRRVAELGEREDSGIYVGRPSDIISLLKQQSEQQYHLEESYRQGNIPIHLIAGQLNIPLIVLYRINPLENSRVSKLTQQPILFTRHGGKFLEDGFSDSLPEWRLNLDITAFLLAAQFDILDRVERVYAPLRIPVDLIQALIQMREKLLSHQPARLEVRQEVLRSVTSGQIQIVENAKPSLVVDRQVIEELGEPWVALYESAVQNQGYLVDSYPLMKKDLSGPVSELPEDVQKYVVNVRAIVEVLRGSGYISNDIYEGALPNLGTESQSPVYRTDLTIGSTLYFDGGTVELLVDAGVLNIAVQNFSIHLEARYVDLLRTESDAIEHKKEAITWLDNLLERIRNGIEGGTYIVIPVKNNVEEIRDETHLPSPSERCVFTLLNCDLQENDVIWFDDRALSAYVNRDSAPIISINEVLKALVAKGVLSHAEYYNRLYRLRAANVRFIPIQTDEICYFLRQARIVNGSLVETPELRTLRQYVAACLLQGTILQHPPLPKNAPNPAGEVSFIVTLHRSITNTIGEVWSEFHDNNDACLARSEWLVTNLYLDVSSARRMIFADAKQNDSAMIAVGITDLLFQVLQFAPEVKQRDIRTAFFEWAFNRIISHQLESDQITIAATADLLKATFLEFTKGRSGSVQDEKDEQTIHLLFQLYYQEMPAVLKEVMDKDDDFTDAFGLDYSTVINIGDLIIEATNFYEGASSAINGRAALVTLLEPTAEVTFVPQDKGSHRNGFHFIHPLTGQAISIGSDEFMLLSDSISERESILRENREWFDFSDDKFEPIVAEIASSEDSVWRFETARDFKNSSASALYQRLSYAMRNRQPLSAHDFIPDSFDGLSRFLRLSTDLVSQHTFSELLNLAAQDILRTEDISDAIARFCGLPSPLPDTLISAVVALGAEEKRELIRQLLKTVRSPIGRIHLTYLLLRIGENAPQLIRLARYTAVHLMSEQGQKEFNAFSAIINWVNDEFQRMPELKLWPVPVRLAFVWTHTHNLHCLFSEVNESPERIETFFDRLKRSRIAIELLESEHDYWFDIAHPRQLKWHIFTLSGLSYGFGPYRHHVTNEMRSLCTRLTLTQSEDGTFTPVFSLLREVAQASNLTGTFLGEDYGNVLAMLVDTDAVEYFQIAKKQLMEEQIVQVETFSAFAWGILGIVVEDGALSQGLGEQIRHIIAHTDFTSYLEQSIESGILALRVATQQLRHIEDEALRVNLTNQFHQAIQIIAEQELSDKNLANINEVIHLQLLDIAWNLAHSRFQNREFIVVFSEIIQQMVDSLPSLLRTLGPALQKLYEELPMPVARHFTRLYLTVRAMS